MVASFEPLDRLLKECIDLLCSQYSKLRSLYPLNSAVTEHLNQNGELGCGLLALRRLLLHLVRSEAIIFI